MRRDVESREQRIGSRDRFIIIEENKASLAHFLSTEMSQHYRTHPRRQLVVSGGSKEILKVRTFDTSRDDLQLSSNHEEAYTCIVLREMQRLKVKSRLTCCAVTQMFLSSLWRTNKISVKKSGCSLVHPEEKDTYWSTKSHCQRRKGSRC